MDDKPLYEHRRMISLSSVIVLAAVLLPAVGTYGTDLAE